MDPHDLRNAWQALESRMALSDRLQWAVLRDTRLVRAKAQLRGLVIGHGLQLLLGIGLVVLGVACWSRNTGTPGLLIAGIAVHAFGLLTVIGAALTLAMAARIDYSAPVLHIQRQLAALLRTYAINADLCGAPWWIMWLPVVVAFAGLGDVPANATTPSWMCLSLTIGGIGLAATWAYCGYRRAHPSAPSDGSVTDAPAATADGTGGIRRSQRLLAEIARFEAG